VPTRNSPTVSPAEAVSPRPAVWSRRSALWPGAVLLVAAIALGLCLDLAHLGAGSLMGDESIYAYPAREAAVHGHWYPPITPKKGIFHSKPPLMVWPVAVSFSLFGVGEWADRLPSALFGALLVGLVYTFAAWLLGTSTGFLAAALLATCRLWLFQHGAREGVGDPLLCVLLMAGLLLYLRFRSTGSRPWFAAACATSVLAALVKGTFGPALLGAIALVWELLRVREPGPAVESGDDIGPLAPWWRAVLPRLPAPLALASAGLAAYALWLLDLHRRGVGVGAFLYRDIVRRSTVGLDSAHVHGLSFYSRHLEDAFGHWWLALVPAAFCLVRELRQGGPRARAWLLVAIWPVVALAILHSSRSSLPWYLHPILPPLAILLAAGCGEVARRLARWPWAPVLLAFFLAVLVGLRGAWAWQTLRQPRPLGQMHRFVLAVRGLPACRVFIDRFTRVAGDIGSWNHFYLAELDDVAKPLPPSQTAIVGCTFVVTERPAEVARQLHARAGSEVMLERRFPEAAKLYIVDFCGGQVARDLG
jgi:4-amino-4-deoxy-L-arabinose transferase-like glycosyltransferase